MGINVLAKALKVKRQHLVRYGLAVRGGETHTRPCGDVLLARCGIAAVDKAQRRPRVYQPAVNGGTTALLRRPAYCGAASATRRLVGLSCQP